MKLRYLPAPDIDAQLLEETVDFLLDGFVPAPGQRLISNNELAEIASRLLEDEHIELIRRSRVQVQLES